MREAIRKRDKRQKAPTLAPVTPKGLKPDPKRKPAEKGEALEGGFKNARLEKAEESEGSSLKQADTPAETPFKAYHDPKVPKPRPASERAQEKSQPSKASKRTQEKSQPFKASERTQEKPQPSKASEGAKERPPSKVSERAKERPQLSKGTKSPKASKRSKAGERDEDVRPIPEVFEAEGRAFSRHTAEREESSERKKTVTSEDIEIREMVLEDLPQVYNLGEKLFTPDRWPTLYRTWDPYEVVELFGADGEFCQVAVLSSEEEAGRDKVVGFALGTLLEKRRSAWTYGYLLWLGVDPSFSRLGIGEDLVDTLTALFIEQGARMMLVDTDGENETALRFFRRIGFGNENQHVFMSMNLTNHPSYRRKRKRRRKETSEKTERNGKMPEGT